MGGGENDVSVDFDEDGPGPSMIFEYFSAAKELLFLTFLLSVHEYWTGDMERTSTTDICNRN